MKKTLRQGESWRFWIIRQNPDGSEIDLTGHTFQAQVRTRATAADVAATFTCTLAASPETDAANHAVLCDLPDTQTLGLSPRQGYEYDIFGVRSDATRYFIDGGTIDIIARVTR